MNSAPRHYVYEWVRPDTNVAFYVGKGCGRRAYSFDFNRNNHTKSVLKYLDKKGMKPCVRILARFINEDSAYEFEEERISFLGLENLTNELPGGRNGGGGMTGKSHRAETKLKIGEANKGKVVSLDTRRKLRNANLGKKAPPEACAIMSITRMGRKASEETCKKISDKVRAAKNTPEGKAVSVAVALEAQNRPDVKLKKSYGISAALRSKPSHWSQKLTCQDIWNVGTLFLSKKEICSMYGIPVGAVTEIRKIVEATLGVGPCLINVNKGRKHSKETIYKCVDARKKNWGSITNEQRLDRGRRMSEGRLLAKVGRLEITFWGS